jgi:hypothetical protein
MTLLFGSSMFVRGNRINRLSKELTAEANDYLASSSSSMFLSTR